MFVKEMTLLSLGGQEEKWGLFAMLYHKIGFGARLSNYCFACFPEARGVCFGLKDMGGNAGARGLAGGKRCPGGGGEQGGAVQEVKVGKPLPGLRAISSFINVSVASIPSPFLPAAHLEPLPSAGDSPQLETRGGVNVDSAENGHRVPKCPSRAELHGRSIYSTIPPGPLFPP